ncbi:hypothetical protein ACO0SA_000834 [Hanseniaspora valbyensis]
MYLNKTLHFRASVNSHTLDKDFDINVHVPSVEETVNYFSNPFWYFIFTMIPLTAILFLSHKLYNCLRDFYIIKKRKYLVFHKQFPCKFTHVLNDDSKMPAGLVSLWDRYMLENSIYNHISKMSELKFLIEQYASVYENLPFLMYQTTYDPVNDSFVELIKWNHLQMSIDEMRVEKYTQHFEYLASLHNYEYARLDRNNNPLLVTTPEKFVGVWFTEKNTVRVIRAPDWWYLSHFSSDDKYEDRITCYWYEQKTWVYKYRSLQ